jgi:hypothetical protein
VPLFFSTNPAAIGCWMSRSSYSEPVAYFFCSWKCVDVDALDDALRDRALVVAEVLEAEAVEAAVDGAEELEQLRVVVLQPRRVRHVAHAQGLRRTWLRFSRPDWTCTISVTNSGP